MFGNSSKSQDVDPTTVLVQALLREQRRHRRWSFLKWVFFAGLVLISINLSHPNFPMTESIKPHAAVMSIKGVIGEGEHADPNQIAGGLRRAFEKPHVKGVILKLNSPGGSAVAANQIFNLIEKLKKKHPEIPVYAVVSDLCASACYYIASSADRIYANPGSIVGSIGVLIDSYGFVGAMEKLGIERRLLTAGEHKGFLDPFSPLKDDDRTFVKSLLVGVHEDFIEHVKKGRGDRLKLSEPNLFSGLAWNGFQAKDLGLIDGFASTREVAESELKVEHLIDYTQKENLLDRMVSRLGASFASELVSKLESKNQAALKPSGF